RKVLAPYVFTTDKGQRFYWLDKVFKRAVKQAGIEDFRFHDLRHTFASRLTMRGIFLRTRSSWGIRP
ncbi:MAG: tyrosine-type recombinase/integrase, partial [Thermodesulfobacteriota bacterium]